MENLETRLRYAIWSVEEDVLANVQRNLMKRMIACVRMDGGHFEHLQISICNDFFVRQNRFQRAYYFHESKKLDKKFNWLLKKQLNEIRKDIRPIRYFCAVQNYHSTDSTPPVSQLLSKSVDMNFSFNPRLSSSPVCIALDPSSFSLRVSPALELRDEWFVNLSSSTIPQEVRLLLQLGDKFCLPIIDKERTVVALLKNVEFNINKLPTEVRTMVGNRSFPIIHSFHNSISHKSPFDKRILNSFNATKKFIRQSGYFVY